MSPTLTIRAQVPTLSTAWAFFCMSNGEPGTNPTAETTASQPSRAAYYEQQCRQFKLRAIYDKLVLEL